MSTKDIGVNKINVFLAINALLKLVHNTKHVSWLWVVAQLVSPGGFGVARGLAAGSW